MKNKITLLVTVFLVFIIFISFFVPHLMISPGTTIKVHSEIATDCFACHTAFLGSTENKCIACHQVSEIGLKTTKGQSIHKENNNVAFHQTLVVDDCIACHSEHKGVKPFRPIGQFSHELLDESIKQKCDSCHTKPGDNLHLNMNENCSSCHKQDNWTPATFEHDKYFRFDRHHPSDCSTCHIDNQYDIYTCYSCHEHSRSNIRGEHIEKGISDYEICVECHRSGDEDEAEYIWKMKRNGGKTPQNINYRRHYDDDDDD